MNVTVEEISSIKKKLSVEMPAAMVQDALNKAVVKVGRKAKLKGFRPGKAPKSVIEKMYGGEIQAEAVQSLVSDGYFKAVVDHKLAIIGQPAITEAGEPVVGEPFRFVAEVEVKPEITAVNYKGLELERERFDFDPQRVEAQIDQMRQTRATLEPAGRDQVAQGDFAVIDFTGFMDGEKFEHGSATDYVLELGAGAFIPGFEEGIVGMSVGETRKLELAFPASYGAKELAGKDVVFEVTLKEVKHKLAPEMTDALAQEFGSQSVAAMREKIHAMLTHEDETRIHSDFEDAVRAKLVEQNPIEIPETMVQGQLDAMFGNFSRNLQQQGMSLEMLGMNRERFDQVYHEAAASRVKSSLILEAIGRQEEIKAEAADLEAKMKQLAERSGTDEQIVRNHFLNPDARRALYLEVFEAKVVDFVAAAGTVRELTAAEVKAKQEAAQKA